MAEQQFPDNTVELDKTWPEMVHRYAAALLGLSVLFMACLAFLLQRRHPSAAVPVRHLLLLLFMVVLQAAFGMWTVTLKLWPQVVTAHLLGGFTTLSLIWLLVLRLHPHGPQPLTERQLSTLAGTQPWLLLSLCLVIAQIALGGWVSANYAALACPDLPRCLAQWLPPTDFGAGFAIAQAIGPNYLGGQLDNHARTAIHLSHRLGALLVTLGVVSTCLALWRTGLVTARRWALWLGLALLLQLGLGVSNILFALPLWVAVGHNAGAALLLLTLITFVHRLLSLP